MSEERLIRQCAPTLAGIKTGSLFPCPYETREELMADVRAFNRRFAARGLCLLPLRLENGLPVTSKQDRLNHGFGTRSMQLLVEKYGGELTFQQEADVVNIYMLLPSRPAST